jgi:hypothetical protein
MIENARNDVFYRGFCVLMIRKVGSLKRRVRSHLAEGLPNMARLLRAKHIWKSKSSKLYGLGTLSEDATSQNGTPPTREAHLQVKIVKALRTRSTFATSKNGTPPAREAHLEVKIVKTLRSRSAF